MSETPFLKIENLGVTRAGAPRALLERFSLALAPGESIVLLGETGCGKEALMRVLGGLPERGEQVTGTVQFGDGAAQRAGRKLHHAPRTAYLPGPYAGPLSPNASVLSQLVRVLAKRLGAPRSSARAELELALGRMAAAPGIDALDARPSDLEPDVIAWGLFAAAFAQTPELILADHPVAGIAPLEMRALAYALQRGTEAARLRADLCRDGNRSGFRAGCAHACHAPWPHRRRGAGGPPCHGPGARLHPHAVPRHGRSRDAAAAQCGTRRAGAADLRSRNSAPPGRPAGPDRESELRIAPRRGAGAGRRGRIGPPRAGTPDHRARPPAHRPDRARCRRHRHPLRHHADASAAAHRLHHRRRRRARSAHDDLGHGGRAIARASEAAAATSWRAIARPRSSA